MGPHSDDRLRKNVGIEAIWSAVIREALASTGTHPRGEAFQDSARNIARFSAGVKDDAKQVAPFLRESDQGVGLAVHHVGDLCLRFGDREESPFELVRSFFGEFSEEFLLVLEMEIEGAGGVSSLSGDRVGSDSPGSAFGEEGEARFEESLACLLGFRHTRAVVPGGPGVLSRGSCGATDDHVTYDVNVSFGLE